MSKVITTIICLILLTSCFHLKVQQKILKVSDLNSVIMAPIYIANELGYYRSEGLEIKFIDFSSGAESIVAVIDGDIDIATSMMLPIAKSIVDGEDIGMISSLCSTNMSKDIITYNSLEDFPKNLENKKLGLTVGTSSEYAMCIFLQTNGMSINDIELINIPPKEQLKSLKDREIDTIISWKPYSSMISNKLTDLSTITLKSYIDTLSLTINTKNKDRMASSYEGFLRATNRGIYYIRNNRDKSKLLLKNSNLDNIELLDIYKFHLGIDNYMIQSLNNQIRWLTENKSVDLMSHINTEYLSHINPNMITIREN